MRTLLASSALALLSALPATAQTIAADFAAEVRATEAERHARYSIGPAGEEMIDRIGPTVGEGHANTWGRWMGNEYVYYDEFYSSAARNLAAWDSAIRFEGMDSDAAEAILVPAMERFREMDARVVRQAAEAYFHVQVRAYHFAQAVAMGSYGPNCIPYRQHMAAADAAWQRAYAVLPSDLQYAVPIPPVEGFTDAEEAVRSVMPDADLPLSAYPDRLALMTLFLEQRGIASDDPTIQALDLLATQSGAQGHSDQAVLLLHRQFEVGGDQMLQAAQAQMALMERAAAVLPAVIASLAAEDRPLTASDIRPLYDFAVRAEQLQSDVRNPISLPSSLARSLAGLRGAVSALQIAEGDADAHQYLSVVNDFATAASSQVSVTSPFAVPAGIVGGITNWNVEGLGAINDAMGAVGDAIRTGHPRDIQRALDLSERVRRTLHPARMAQHWLHGAASGLASNVPFGRALAAEFVDMLAPMEEEQPEGDPEDYSGYCY